MRLPANYILPDAVVVELVVAGKSDESTPAERQREEYLDCCISPHLNSPAVILDKI